jgi:hypothetical protein
VLLAILDQRKQRVERAARGADQRFSLTPDFVDDRILS